MIRHKAFRTGNALQEFTRDTVPAHAYYSTAYYLDPAQEMDKKGWQGADLAFDVDADHIQTPCKGEHDSWTCTQCGTHRMGTHPQRCPKCGSERIEEQVWLCDKCLDAAKDEVLKLIEFLSQDFGFSKGEIKICFSGHRGYHIHVRSLTARQLSSDERKEIVDYVQGTGIDPALHGVHAPRGVSADAPLPNPSDKGWRGRFVRELREIVVQSSLQDLVDLKLPSTAAASVVKNRELLSSAILTNRTLTTVRGLGPRSWERLFQAAIERGSAKVDTVVTTDIHRLIRIPETLNGKTGFRALEVTHIENFDPFADPVVHEGEQAVFVESAPSFRVGNETFGPYRNERVTLPMAAALLLVCKGRATAVGD